MNIKNLISGFLSASIFASQLSFAGLFVEHETTITFYEDGYGYAMGDMGTARFSENDTALIGCGATHYSAGYYESEVMGYCQASTATGESVFCYTEDERLVNAISAISESSFISFDFNGEGECIRVRNAHNSYSLR